MTTTKEKSPTVSVATAREIYTVAGGQCSFLCCPRSVIYESLTKKKTRLGNIAHIVADSVDGPRGDDPLPLSERAKKENLMLMCTEHHDFIDKKENVPDYPVPLLREYKRRHEAHISRMVQVQLTDKTYAVRIQGMIRSKTTDISDAEIRLAVLEQEKRHVEEIIDIDLRSIPDTADAAYWNICRQTITQHVQQRLEPILTRKGARFSVFGLARIPLLCHFGHVLGDKVATTFYAKHKDDGEAWSWPTSAPAVEFEVLVHGKPNAERAALFARVSGGDLSRLPISKDDLVYEIRPIDVEPSYMLMRSSQTLSNFRTAYQKYMSMFESSNRPTRTIDYFLAVPAPIAILCGREVPRDVGPLPRIFDRIDDNYELAFELGA